MSEIQSGSVKELWKVSYPMMVNFLSMTLMVFVDRLFLSWYSADSLNAAVQAGTLSWGLILGWLTMASMSEVFVSQFNGAKQYSRIGSAVWQMIWLCIVSYVFFIPMGYWGSNLIYSIDIHPLEAIYFRYWMYFGPVFAMISAIGGFYVGRGKTKVMQNMAILGNATNIVLDPIMIFGVKGFFPSLGIKGAVIASGIGGIIQVVVLFCLFMRNKYRDQYGTLDCRFRPSLFGKTLKVGLPPSVFVTIELVGWSLFYLMMAEISAIHIFVAGVCQSVLILFIFYGMGLEKGALAVVGNFIGAKTPEKVTQVFKSGLKLIAYFIALGSVFLIIFPNSIIDWFFLHPVDDVAASSFSAAETTHIKDLIRWGLGFTLVFLLFENLRWLLNGILTAAGDTMFLLIAGAFNVWVLLLLPTYFFVMVPKNSIILAFVIWVLYASISMFIIYGRYRLGKWKKKQLIEEPKENGYTPTS